MLALIGLTWDLHPHPRTQQLYLSSALGALSSCLRCVGGVLVSSLAMPLPVCRAHCSRPQPADGSPDLTSVLPCCRGPTWQPLDLILALVCGLTYLTLDLSHHCDVALWSGLLVEPALLTLLRYCGNGLWLERSPCPAGHVIPLGVCPLRSSRPLLLLCGT